MLFIFIVNKRDSISSSSSSSSSEPVEPVSPKALPAELTLDVTFDFLDLPDLPDFVNEPPYNIGCVLLCIICLLLLAAKDDFNDCFLYFFLLL